MANPKGGKGSTGPTKEELSIATQMAGMLSQMAMTSDRIARSFETQADATKRMSENMQGSGDVVSQLTEVNKTLKEIASSLQGLNESSAAAFAAMATNAGTATEATGKLGDAAKKAAGAIGEQTTSLQDLQKKLGATGKDSLSTKQKMAALGEYLEKDFPVATGAALGALSGLKQGFSNLMAMGSGILGFASSIAGAIFEIGKSIITIPFKLFDGLVNMAKKGMGGISEYAQAINNLRKEFGALNGPLTSTIKSVAHDMKGFSDSGLSAFSVFGNVAERMEHLIKLFSAGGAILQKFTQEFKENGGAILGMQKGLGVTDEQLADMGKIAKSTGKTLTSSLIDMTKYATNLGKAFDVDFKVLSKGMAKASSDMSNFGSMSQKQIGVAVTYFAKLGVEVDKVTGVMDAFSTFDEAADKVSTLNQVMGTNVDAMKMVNAEDPSERIEHLREQFAKAGIDGEKMSRAQRMMVKQLTSLDDAEQKLIFSSKNRGVSLAQIRKEGDKAEKKTMTQTEAMGKLADAMDRMLKSGEAKEGGFFGHFFQGFTDGLQRTKEFRELMTNIGKSLTVVYQAGIRLGKAFVDFFPGVKDFLGGLSDIFKPEKFKKLANGVVDVFVGFFKDLESGKASFPDLMERLKEKFFNFFDSEKGAGQKVMDGFKKIMMAIQVIVAGGVKWLLESVTGFIKNIVNFIKNPTDVPGVGGLADAASSYISPIGQAFKDGWKELGPALGELMGVLFDKLGEIILPKIKAFAADNLPIIAAVLFGPAALQAFLGAGTAMMSKAIGGMLTKAISGPDTQQLILKEMQGLSKTLQSTGAPNLAAPTSAIDGAAGAAPGLKAASAAGTGINWAAIGTFLIGFAGVMAIGLLTFYVAAKIVKDMDKETVIKALAIVLAVSIAALPVAFAMQLLGNMPPVNFPMLVVGLIGLGIAMVALAALGLIVAAIASGLAMSSILKGIVLILGMSLAAITVAGALALVMVAGAAFSGGGAALLVPGLVAIGIGIVALAAMGVALVTTTASLDLGNVTKAMIVILGMSLVALAVAASLALIMAAGAIMVFSGGSAVLMLAAGFAAVALGVAGLALLAVELVKKSTEIDMNKLKMGGDIIVEAAKVVGVAALAIGAATLVGAVMVFSGGLGALAMVAGLAAITLVLGDKDGGLVNLAMTISTSVADMPSDIGPKAEAFTKIMDSIAKIAQVIPATLNEMDLGFFEDSSAQTQKINAVGTMIGELMGSRAPSKGLIGVVDTILTGLGEMKPEQVEAAKAIGPVLQGVAGIASAFSSVGSSMGEAFKNIDDDDFEKLGPIITRMGALVDQIADKIPQVINGIQPIIQLASGKDINVEGVKAVGSLIQVLGPIAQALAPPASVMSMLTKLAEEDNDEVAPVMQKVTEYVDKVGDVLKGDDGLLAVMGKQIKEIIKQMGQVNISESTGKALQALGPILSTVVNFLTSMMDKGLEMVKDPKLKELIKNKSFADILGDLTKFAGDVLAKLSGSIPDLVKGIAGGLADAASKLSPEQMKNLEPLGKLVESILKLVVALMPKPEWPPAPDPSKVAAGAHVVTNMTASFPSIKKILKRMKKSLPGLINTLVDTVKNAKIGDFGVFSRNVDVITKLFDVLPKISDLAKAMSDGQKQIENVNMSQEQGKKLAFSLDAVAWGIKGIIDEKYYHSIGGVGRTPIQFFIDAFKDKIWTQAAVLNLSGPKVFLENLKKIVDLVKGFDSAANNLTTSKESGIAMAASIDAVAWTIGFLADTNLYNGAGGVGRAPLPFFVYIFGMDVWTKAQSAVLGKLPVVQSLVGGLKGMVTAVNEIGKVSTATDFSASKGVGVKAAAAVDAVAWALGGIADDGVYLALGGTAGASPLTMMGLVLNKDWAGANLLQKKQGTILKFIGNMTQVASSLETLSGKLKISGKNAYGPMVGAIEQMMNAIGLIDAAVSRAGTVNIKTTLDRFKANFGTVLGKSGQHTVTTKDVNIHVAFQILMDGKGVEAAIVSNKESVVRKKINLLYAAIGGMDISKVTPGALPSADVSGVNESQQTQNRVITPLQTVHDDGAAAANAYDNTGATGTNWEKAK